MPTAPATLTAAPTSPDRSDRATFSARAVALDDWTKNTHIPELQAAMDNVYANALEVASTATTSGDLVALAAAAANYVGLWSAQTGPLNKPASVSHNGNYWALNTDLADVTAATPGVSGSWSALNVGAGGATEQSSAVDVTLTAASYRVQAVAMTAADKSVNMPSATTLQTGGALFVVKNTGALAFTIRNASGTLLAALDPGQLATLYLANGATSAGVWAVGTTQANALAQTIYQATALAVNAVSSTHLSVTAMSATQAIAVWAGASGYVNACTLNISGTTITAGAILVVNAVSSRYISVAAVSASQAVVTYAGSSDYLNTCTLNMSATQAVGAYSGTSSYTEARTLNISGTTITSGALLVVNAINTSYQTVAAVSATQAVLAYSSSSAGVQTCTLNVSGTTLTAGAILTLSSAALGRFPSVCAMSATQAAISYTGPTPAFQYQARMLTISGTTITADAVLAQFVTMVDSVFNSLQKITANKLVSFSSSDGVGTGSTYAGRAQVLGVTDAQFTPGPAVTVKGSTGAYGQLAILAETKALAVYLQSSGYIQARVLEIGA